MHIEDNTDKFIKELNTAMANTSNSIGLKILATMQGNTPVDSGTLKRSENYNVESTDNSYKIEVGVDGTFVNNKNGQTTDKYAAKVEFEDKSYVRQTFNDMQDEVEKDFTEAIRNTTGGF